MADKTNTPTPTVPTPIPTRPATPADPTAIPSAVPVAPTSPPTPTGPTLPKPPVAFAPVPPTPSAPVVVGPVGPGGPSVSGPMPGGPVTNTGLVAPVTHAPGEPGLVGPIEPKDKDLKDLSGQNTLYGSAVAPQVPIASGVPQKVLYAPKALKTMFVSDRVVNHAQWVNGERIYGISGPGAEAWRVVQRDDNGVIVFDKTGFTSRQGSQDYHGLVAQLGTRKAEIEFRDARGWVSTYDGKLNTEAAIDL